MAEQGRDLEGMDVDLDELRHNLNKLKKGRYVNDQFKYAMQMKCVMTHDRRFHQLKSSITIYYEHFIQGLTIIQLSPYTQIRCLPRRL